MVGFLRKKKSDRAVLSGGTVLDRKGKVDNTSLLNGDGEPMEGSLYDIHGKRVSHTQRSSDEENRPTPVNNTGYPPVMATGTYPPQHSSYGHHQQPQQQPTGVYGYGNNLPQQQQQYSQQSHQQYGQHAPQQYGQQPPQQFGQQPPQQFGQQPPQQFGQQQYPPTTLSGQYQYPVRYGQMPPPMPTAAPKRSRFRLPGIGKKN